MTLEACVNSAPSAIEAANGGADRVELCENMAEGGCTPSHGSIVLARKMISIGLFVMIRPRGSDFFYSDEEFDVMKEDILMAKNVGADGVVFGLLNPDGTVDKERTKKLVDLSGPMEVTFHRAFDMTNDPFQAMEDLISLGIGRILTSGQQENVLSGANLIRELIMNANGRIVIMPGGGIKEYNIKEVIEATGAREYHLYLPKSLPSRMKFINKNIHLGKKDSPEFESVIVDAEKIRKVKEIMKTNG